MQKTIPLQLLNVLASFDYCIIYLLSHCDSLKKTCKKVDNAFEKNKRFQHGRKGGKDRKRKKEGEKITIIVIHGEKAKIHNEMRTY